MATRPNTTLLKRVQVLEAPAKAELRVMLVPKPCTASEFEAVAIPMQAALLAASMRDRQDRSE
jgi:hypothetical protein